MMQIKNATEITQIFQSSVLSNLAAEIRTATGEFVESYLALSDVRHHVVAGIVDVLPAPTFESVRPPRQQSMALRGTLAAWSSTASPTHTATHTTVAAKAHADAPKHVKTTVGALDDVEASDALRCTAFAVTAFAIVFALSPASLGI